MTLDLPERKDRRGDGASGTLRTCTRRIDLAMVAAVTPGFSGADLKNLVNEAAILAARGGDARVGSTRPLVGVAGVMIG